jgi:hypothetical protein
MDYCSFLKLEKWNKEDLTWIGTDVGLNGTAETAQLTATPLPAVIPRGGSATTARNVHAAKATQSGPTIVAVTLGAGAYSTCNTCDHTL